MRHPRVLSAARNREDGPMPRDGTFILSDLRSPTLSIVCEPCDRHGTYNVASLMERHGDTKLTDLLQELADCPKAHAQSISMTRCTAVYGKDSRWSTS
jgi:hypothetical protein